MSDPNELIDQHYADGGEVTDPNDLINQHYSQQMGNQVVSAQTSPQSPEDDMIQKFAAPILNEDLYGGPTEQTKTLLEGLASPVTFGLSTLAERKAGQTPEEIQGRREANPITYGLGQVLGVASGAGAAGVFSAAGRGAMALTGAGETVAGRVAAQAFSNAVEGAVLQSNDEVS